MGVGSRRSAGSPLEATEALSPVTHPSCTDRALGWGERGAEGREASRCARPARPVSTNSGTATAGRSAPAQPGGPFQGGIAPGLASRRARPGIGWGPGACYFGVALSFALPSSTTTRNSTDSQLNCFAIFGSCCLMIAASLSGPKPSSDSPAFRFAATSAS